MIEGLDQLMPTFDPDIAKLAQRTLITKAKTWWVGTNVKDKPQGLTMFTGGFLKYREHCAAAVEGGYRNFAFESVAAASAT